MSMQMDSSDQANRLLMMLGDTVSKWAMIFKMDIYSRYFIHYVVL